MNTEITAPLAALRQKIEAESDVKRLHKLIERDGVFYYLIETPFATFPKAVVGETNADFTTVRRLCCSTSLRGAEQHWFDNIAAPEGKKTKPEKIALLKGLINKREALPFHIDTTRINEAFDLCDDEPEHGFFERLCDFGDLIREAYEASEIGLDEHKALMIGSYAGVHLHTKRNGTSRRTA